MLRIEFDPGKISFDEYWKVPGAIHGPTHAEQAGKTIGPQFRSVTFYHNDEQKEKAEKYKAVLDKSGTFDQPIITAIEPFTHFYEAENHHNDYYKNHNSQPYCYYVIKPKMDKLKKGITDKLKH